MLRNNPLANGLIINFTLEIRHRRTQEQRHKYTAQVLLMHNKDRLVGWNITIA